VNPKGLPLMPAIHPRALKYLRAVTAPGLRIERMNSVSGSAHSASPVVSAGQ
jgi:hypothetical protein